MNKSTQILNLQRKIRKSDNYHFDLIRDFRDGDKIDLEKLHDDILKTDKLRKRLTELGGEVPRNPNFG